MLTVGVFLCRRCLSVLLFYVSSHISFLSKTFVTKLAYKLFLPMYCSVKLQTCKALESFATNLTLVFLLHAGTLGTLGEVVSRHFWDVDKMVTKWAVVFCGVLVHLEVIVQAGLAVECPAAELTPPPAALSWEYEEKNENFFFIKELMNLIYNRGCPKMLI